MIARTIVNHGLNIQQHDFVNVKNFTDLPQATPYYGQDYDNITYRLGM